MPTRCPNCSEVLWSQFDMVYLDEVGLCYTCDTDETSDQTAEMILQAISEEK